MRGLRNLFYRATLGDQSYRFLFEPGPPDEAVVVDCETTGLDPRRDELVAVAAIRVRGDRILTSEAYRAVVRPDRAPGSASIKVHRLRAQEVASGRAAHAVLPELLRFIGGRPLVGYYVDFDVAVLDRYVMGLIQAKLPNPRVEVSAMYHDLKYRRAPPGAELDLRFATILAELGIPDIGRHDAFDDALMTAMAYVQLRDMIRRGARLATPPRTRRDAPLGA